MIKIGITGGIGSGKSFVCSILEKMGYNIFYSDLEAKKIMNQNKELIEQIKNIVGKNAYEKGEINKPIIRDFLFKNETNRKKINSLVHPLVFHEFEEWAKIQNQKIIFNESALLFETESYRRFDKTILVTAPDEIKINRLTRRDGLTIDEIKSRFKTQLNDNDKMENADYIIKNNEKILLIPQINKILIDLK